MSKRTLKKKAKFEDDMASLVESFQGAKAIICLSIVINDKGGVETYKAVYNFPEELGNLLVKMAEKTLEVLEEQNG